MAAVTAAAAGTVLAVGLLGVRVFGAPAPAKPTPAEVYVKNADGPATPLRGSLVTFDEHGFTLHVGSDDKTLAWTDVTPATGFALKQKTIDRTQAEQVLALGRFGWSIGAKDQARQTLATAVRMNPGLQSEADAIVSVPAGSAVLAAASTRPAKPAVRELIREGHDPVASVKPVAPPEPGASAAPEKFHVATPAEAAAAMARARKQADTVKAKIDVTLASFETDHFLVFTDWQTPEYDFIRQNLESAYRVVATQFEADPKANVFVGKLPVYMLAEHEDFTHFARDIDRWPDIPEGIAGYYMGTSDGIGHMAMWKPTRHSNKADSLEDAKRRWAYVLTHEFTHAFLARYKSNVFVSRWLNEGIAEVIAQHQFPDNSRRQMARLMAASAADVSSVFDDSHLPTGEYYPVMQSMVEMLVAGDKSAFLKLIDAIKDGVPAETALNTFYHCTYTQFAEKWRGWAKSRPDNG